MATDDQSPNLAPLAVPSTEEPEGGRRTVVVSPDQVWTAATPLTMTPDELRREARRSFFAPIWTVLAVSTALLTLFLAALLLLIWLRR